MCKKSVCERFHNKPPYLIANHFLRDMLRLRSMERTISKYTDPLGEPRWQYLLRYGSRWYRNLKWEHTHTHTQKNTLVWKRYDDDVISLWNISVEEITGLTEQALSHHPFIKFTDTIVRSKRNSEGKESTFANSRSRVGLSRLFNFLNINITRNSFSDWRILPRSKLRILTRSTGGVPGDK